MGSDGWVTCTVDDIKASVPNALATGPFGSAISSRHFQDFGVPVIRGSNLSQDIGIRLCDEGLVYLSDEKAQEFSRSIARRGDLVFTCWGSIDQVGLIDNRSQYPEYVVSNKQMKLTPDPNHATGLYLYYVFSSSTMRGHILNQGIGSSVPGFNLGQLKSIKLTLPPLRQQQAIAHILGTLDDKIELNRRMNQTLEAMARAIFKSWFVDFDPVRAKAEGRDSGLPGHIADLFPNSFEDSELGEIPKGWRALPLPDAIEVNPTRRLRNGDVAPYLDMANMPTKGHTPDKLVERSYGSGMRFANGDTLMARITPCLENGKTAYVDFLEEGQVGWGSTEYIVLHPRPPLPPEFAYCLARSEEFREFAIQSMTGSSGRQRVPAESLAHYLIALPTCQVAEQFGSLVNPSFKRASAASQESRTFAALRDTLLPKLISGELRIKDAERYIERVL